MEPLYRQRLIGAMVLVAVAVVVVPLLLGEPRPAREEGGVVVSVPEAPRFEGPDSPEQEAVLRMDAPDAFAPEDLAPPAPSAESLDAWLNPPGTGTAAGVAVGAAPSAEAVQAAAGAAAATKAPPARTTAVAEDSPISAQSAEDAEDAGAAGGGVWVVQVGSFAELDNARRRVEQLQARAFEAWVAEPEQPGGPFRVWVGPELERANATALQARIQRELAIDAQVKRHVSR